MHRLTWIWVLFIVMVFVRAAVASMKDGELAEAARPLGADLARDLGGDGKPDLFLWLDTDGRARRMLYLDGAKGEPDVVDLNPGDLSRGPHLVIFLDGFGYDVVRAYWEEGGLRLFPPPSRVIAPYPAMTDLCLTAALGLPRCRAYEAAGFDPAANRTEGGVWDYVRGLNQPYNRVLDYRRSPLLDGFTYLLPGCAFTSESGRCVRRFLETRRDAFFGYLVSSAGMSTRRGAEGQRQCLRRLEALLYEVVRETRGRCTLTVLSDHGHTYTPSRPAALDRELKRKGWRLRDRLDGDRDVVSPRLGLVTYAGFWTRKPGELSSDLTGCEAVELVSFSENGAVTVLDARGGRARVEHRDGRFAYRQLSGDPLGLETVLGGLHPDAEGFYDEADLFRATAAHPWPDPLRRLWRAHVDLVDKPPDVVVSLKDAWYVGSGFLSRMVSIRSTHGGLNYANSAAFAFSTAGPLPENLRTEDLPAAMRRLTGRPWPR
ncbi:MAG: hypothetical protein KA419_20220 [Acidobacteria bacterium]|nr:hypothetical protein [Acidobacteriota bacterium]